MKRRLLRAGSWHLVKRTIKLIPVVGSVFALGLAGYEIRKKGLIPGVAHVGLDVIPVVGATKNVIEIFAGDLIPDKKTPTPENGSASQAVADNSISVPERASVEEAGKDVGLTNS